VAGRPSRCYARRSRAAGWIRGRGRSTRACWRRRCRQLWPRRSRAGVRLGATTPRLHGPAASGVHRGRGWTKRKRGLAAWVVLDAGGGDRPDGRPPARPGRTGDGPGSRETEHAAGGRRRPQSAGAGPAVPGIWNARCADVVPRGFLGLLVPARDGELSSADQGGTGGAAPPLRRAGMGNAAGNGGLIRCGHHELELDEEVRRAEDGHAGQRAGHRAGRGWRACGWRQENSGAGVMMAPVDRPNW